jgi:hypothetical protein
VNLVRGRGIGVRGRIVGVDMMGLMSSRMNLMGDRRRDVARILGVDRRDLVGDRIRDVGSILGVGRMVVVGNRSRGKSRDMGGRMDKLVGDIVADTRVESQLSTVIFTKVKKTERCIRSVIIVCGLEIDSTFCQCRRCSDRC